MYNIVRIHTPLVALPNNAIRVSTLSTIPEELREAIQIVNAELWLNSNNGTQTAPLSSVIAYEKSEKTPGGYNCWAVAGPHTDVIKIGESLYINPPIIHAMLIPAPNDVRPVWAHNCNLTYNGDGTATLQSEKGCTTGRIGIDFLLCHGMKVHGSCNSSILIREDPSYNDYLVCDASGTDIGKLCELYPA